MQKIVFRELADEHPDADTVEVNFFLQEQEHEASKRNGLSLLLRHSAVLMSKSLIWTAGSCW